MTTPTLLLVDDDPEICQFLSVLLELEGFAPMRAGGAEEALALASAHLLAAVLIDVAMPGIDGLELCRMLRAGGLTAPVLVLSARPGAELRKRALAAGADEFVRKPFDNAELVGRVRSLIERRPD